jgi:hypothetical protein
LGVVWGKSRGLRVRPLLDRARCVHYIQLQHFLLEKFFMENEDRDFLNRTMTTRGIPSGSDAQRLRKLTLEQSLDRILRSKPGDEPQK